jgi:hypothetical protein
MLEETLYEVRKANGVPLHWNHKNSEQIQCDE